ncbi:MAG: glycosyltransferase [Nodosilinea sp.]
MRLALIFANYGPYHLARLRSTQAALRPPGWEVIGIELARDQIEYPWQAHTSQRPFQLITLFSDQTYEQIPWAALIWRMFRTLSQINPDILAIAGYSEPGMLAALLWARCHGKKTILMSESKADDAARRGWQERIKQWLISHYDGALVGGSPHKRYLQDLGMPGATIRMGYDVVDNQAFANDRTTALPAPIKAPYFLVICRFVPKKNLPFILQAYADYCTRVGSKAWHLVLCGDGELRPQIIAQITHLGLEAQVHLPGFLQQDQLLPYFGHAQCFILASSQEQWGLVVNEAMAASLPVLVSNRCGCFEDLVIEGVNGFGFDPDISLELTQLMVQVTQADYDLLNIGKIASDHINRHFPLSGFGQGMAQVIESIIKE